MIALHHGDCLDALHTLPDASVHAVVTDPPYGLSEHKPAEVAECLRAWLDGEPYVAGSVRKGKKHCASGFLGGVGVGVFDADGPDAHGAHGLVAFNVRVSTTPVNWPINLDDKGAVREEEIGANPSGPEVKWLLPDEGDSAAVEGGRDRSFVLRRAEAAFGCDSVCSCFTEGGDGIFRVLVRLCDDALGQAETSSCIVAFARTELRAVLTLDVRRLSAELAPAQCASHVDAGIEVVRSQHVGARPGAGCLPSVLKPGGICEVGDATNGTNARDMLLVHSVFLERLQNPIIYRGGMMGKAWDAWVPGPEVWRECLRVLKPGGHMLVFAGTRTQDLMGMAVRLAGFEIRDSVHWVYGSGFPKSADISKALDKSVGAERVVTGAARGHVDSGGVHDDDNYVWKPVYDRRDTPATPAARQWQGFGTSLKPAHEPVLIARKPLDGTVAQNILKHGCGGLNIDGCRVEVTDGAQYAANFAGDRGHDGNRERQSGFKMTAGKRPLVVSNRRDGNNTYQPGLQGSVQVPGGTDLGRWPANLVHDGSAVVVGLFPDTGISTGGRTIKRSGGGNVGSGKASEATWTNDDPGFGDSGSAARYFQACPQDPDPDPLIYCPKASRRDRDDGLIGPELRTGGMKATADGSMLTGAGNPRTTARRNTHNTVKPTSLMRYLVRLVTPPGGTVLDPFMGSGSTGKACALEGFAFIGIEREQEYLDIARARIDHAQQQAAEVAEPVDEQLELELDAA